MSRKLWVCFGIEVCLTDLADVRNLTVFAIEERVTTKAELAEILIERGNYLILFDKNHFSMVAWFSGVSIVPQPLWAPMGLSFFHGKT
jgi:hypothetical protein